MTDIFSSTQELIAEFRDLNDKEFVPGKIFYAEHDKLHYQLRGRLSVFQAWLSHLIDSRYKAMALTNQVVLWDEAIETQISTTIKSIQEALQ